MDGWRQRQAARGNIGEERMGDPEEQKLATWANQGAPECAHGRDPTGGRPYWGGGTDGAHAVGPAHSILSEHAAESHVVGATSRDTWVTAHPLEITNETRRALVSIASPQCFLA
ncbi:hypothetical protein GW17_00016888 [Ensete ventricosum]|nr:hypothetical protein GW17_00016888 [Ensete ventricosum]